MAVFSNAAARTSNLATSHGCTQSLWFNTVHEVFLLETFLHIVYNQRVIFLFTPINSRVNTSLLNSNLILNKVLELHICAIRQEAF